jgi:hypothetical protein
MHQRVHLAYRIGSSVKRLRIRQHEHWILGSSPTQSMDMSAYLVYFLKEVTQAYEMLYILVCLTVGLSVPHFDFRTRWPTLARQLCSRYLL